MVHFTKYVSLALFNIIISVIRRSSMQSVNALVLYNNCYGR